MQAILHDRLPIAKIVNAQVIPLEDAIKGYAQFDKGAPIKFVLDPHGLVAKTAFVQASPKSFARRRPGAEKLGPAETDESVASAIFRLNWAFSFTASSFSGVAAPIVHARLGNQS
jgi:hypothetical protein